MSFPLHPRSAQTEAKRIISEVVYINIATVSVDGHPWNTPVYAAFDSRYNFYWVSSPKSQHSKNIEANGRAYVTIYDATRKHGTLGVYLQGRARVLFRQPEITRAIGVFYGRKGHPVKTALNFLGSSPRRLYKFTPSSSWMNTYTKTGGYWIDGRTPFKLIPR